MKKLFLLTSLVIVLVLAAVIVGCGTQPVPARPAQQAAAEPTKPAPAPAPAATPAPVKQVSLVDQVKNSGHAKIFPTMIVKGPDVKKADTEHYADNCLDCHSAYRIVDDKNAKLDDFFTGGKLADKVEGISCRVCHVFGGKDLMTLRNKGWESCGTCHVSSKTADPQVGSAVHHPQFQVIKGIAIGDLPAEPSYKYANMKDSFSCTDCHITNSQNHTFFVPGVTATYSDPEKIKRSGTKIDYNQFKTVFNQDKCKTCHSDPQPVVDKLKAHQEEIGKRLDDLSKISDEWTKKIAAMTPEQQKADPKATAFNNGQTFYTIIEADASKGAHNYEYAKACLDKAEEYWKALK